MPIGAGPNAYRGGANLKFKLGTREFFCGVYLTKPNKKGHYNDMATPTGSEIIAIL